MKKVLKLISSFVIGTLMGITGLIAGLLFFSDMPLSDFYQKLSTIQISYMAGVMLSSILSVCLSIFLQIILHEGGHLICGLATGYRFVSFRILNLTFIRLNHKICIKRFSIAGTGGQCLLVPPEKPLSSISCVWYNLGGVAANLLTAIIAIILLLTIDSMPYFLEVFLGVLSLIGIFMGLMNGIPMKIGGIGNDAHNIILFLKDEKSKKALMTQLRVNALAQEGVRPKDMPQEWFQKEGEPNYKDALQITIYLMEASRLQDQEEWDAAYTAFEEIMSHKDEVMGLLVKETACELLFTALVTGRSERAEELYTPELSVYIEQYKKVMSSKQRILCALALYREKDITKAKEIYDTVCQQRTKYLMQGEVNMDIALMQSILTAEKVL